MWLKMSILRIDAGHDITPRGAADVTRIRLATWEKQPPRTQRSLRIKSLRARRSPRLLETGLFPVSWRHDDQTARARAGGDVGAHRHAASRTDRHRIRLDSVGRTHPQFHVGHDRARVG